MDHAGLSICAGKITEEAPELHHESSYASRLYAYMGRKNQVEWLIERLKSNPRRALCDHHHV